MTTQYSYIVFFFAFRLIVTQIDKYKTINFQEYLCIFKRGAEFLLFNSLKRRQTGFRIRGEFHIDTQSTEKLDAGFQSIQNILLSQNVPLEQCANLTSTKFSELGGMLIVFSHSVFMKTLCEH